MVNDLYFDCPLCSHVVKAESRLVGQMVACPDCQNEISVPDIRDGLNPRFKSEEQVVKVAQVQKRNNKRKEANADLLIENLQSLWRRREEQGRQLEYIRFNAELCVKQIQLLQQEHESAEPIPESTAGISGDVPVESRRYLQYSLAFACLTLAAGIAAMVLF